MIAVKPGSKGKTLTNYILRNICFYYANNLFLSNKHLNMQSLEKFLTRKNLLVINVVVCIFSASIFYFRICIDAAWIVIAVINLYLFLLIYCLATCSDLLAANRTHTLTGWMVDILPKSRDGLLAFFFLFTSVVLLFARIYIDYPKDFSKTTDLTRESIYTSICTLTTVSTGNFNPSSPNGQYSNLLEILTGLNLFISALPILLSRVSKID